MTLVSVLVGMHFAAWSSQSVEAATPTPEACFSQVRLTPDGSDPEGRITGVDVTPDGRYLALARQVVIGENLWAASVVRVDTDAGTNLRIDIAADGGSPDGGAWGPSITPDGQFVAFVSDSDDLVVGDDNGRADVFVREVTTGLTERVSVGESGTSGAWAERSITSGPRRATGLSADGRHIVFSSEQPLVASDVDGKSDVYVRDRQSGVTRLVSVAPIAGGALVEGIDGAISADGRYIVFIGNDGNQLNVYRYDLVDEATEIVNEYANGPNRLPPGPPPAISGDGRFVAFNSYDPLASGDARGQVYVRDMTSASFRSTSALDITAHDGTIAIDATGSTVAFQVHDRSWVVYHSDGRRRVIRDDAGEPATAVGLAFVGDGTEVVYVANQGFIGGQPMRTKARRALIERAGITELSQGPSSLEVSEIRQGETIAVDISGFNLAPDTSYSFDGGVTLDNVDTSMAVATGRLSAGPNATLGPRVLTVTSGLGCSMESSLVRVLDGTPEVTSVSVSRLRPGRTVPVFVSGKNLTCPCQVSFTNGVIAGVAVSQPAGQSLTVSVTTPAFTSDGYTDLSITNAFGKSAVISGAMALHTTEGEFHPLVPARILDTRYGNGSVLSPIGQDPRTVLVAGRGGVPADGKASAVVMNVTVTDPTRAAYVTVWPSGSPLPTASNLNVVASQTVPNQVTVPLGAAGDVNVYVSAGTAHVIFDVVGYYSTAAGMPGGRFLPIVPARLLDTRTMAQPLGPGEVGTLLFPPSPNAAMVLNVTVTAPSASGYLTIAPSGPLPLASSLNFAPGQTVANLVTVGLADTNGIDIFNSGGNTHVIVDVVGVFGDETSYTGDAVFRPLTPRRVLDTRIGLGAPTALLEASSVLRVEMAGRLGVPEGASAITGNVTVTNPTAGSYLTIWPDGFERPLASSLNFGPLETVPNSVVMSLGIAGDLEIFNAVGQTDVIADVSGWFTPVLPGSVSANASRAIGHQIARPMGVSSGPGVNVCARCLPAPPTVVGWDRRDPTRSFTAKG